MEILYQNNDHKCVMFDDLAVGGMIQATQFVIVDGDEAMILDPGGHKVFSSLIKEIAEVVSVSKLKHIFFSHQDPDIVASGNAWLMLTEAKAYLSEHWTRFVMHFGIDDYISKRINPIPDNGMEIKVGGRNLSVIPAHFMHSAANFQIYDPESKILFSGDLGASFGQNYNIVENFNEHIKYMEIFHKRFIPGNEILKKWVNMVRKLDIEQIAPQHGAVLSGKEDIENFFIWLENLKCGVSLLDENLNFKG